MKFIRWLFSNIILIAFILALTYAYVYWDNLTGQDTPAGKAIAVLKDEFESVREFVESYQPDIDTAKQSHVRIAETANTEPRVAVVPEPAAAPSLPPQQQTTLQPPIPPSAGKAAEDAPAGEASKGVASYQLWIAARSAFQAGQYQKSIDLYREIVDANHDSFDAWGEMGNVYLRIGDPKQAGAAYYEAAVVMVRLGQTARARSVLPLLHRLDRDKAKQLNDLILKPASRGDV
jgi:tetratricopeptide (TPR) repeat protein